MSLREVICTVRAVNRASREFARIESDAQRLTTRIKNLGTTMAGLGAAGSALTYVAQGFGLINDEQAKVTQSALTLITVLGLLLRTETGIAIAHKVYAAACAFATAVQNALNISYATFLALTGVGIAVILAAAAAMYSFANSMNTATASVQSFNQTAVSTPERVKGITRTGDAELLRRGIE